MLIKVAHSVRAIVSNEHGSIEVLIMYGRLDIRAPEKAKQEIFAPGPPERLIWPWMNLWISEDLI